MLILIISKIETSTEWGEKNCCARKKTCFIFHSSFRYKRGCKFALGLIKRWVQRLKRLRKKIKKKFSADGKQFENGEVSYDSCVIHNTSGISLFKKKKNFFNFLSYQIIWIVMHLRACFAVNWKSIWSHCTKSSVECTKAFCVADHGSSWWNIRFTSTSSNCLCTSTRIDEVVGSGWVNRCTDSGQWYSISWGACIKCISHLWPS